MSRPFPPRHPPSPSSFFRVNGKIRAREVRVISPDNKQLGVIQTSEALRLAQVHGVDLVEIVPNATPPVCRLVDFGKFRYEQSKKDKDVKKHHAGKVKEVQLSANIDPHDFKVKLSHAIDFLCEDMKVKVSLRFRGREMAHQEIGFQQVNNFVRDLGPWGHPDTQPKLIGKGINVMIAPLPKAKRAKNPKGDAAPKMAGDDEDADDAALAEAMSQDRKGNRERIATDAAENPTKFGSSPFDKLPTQEEKAPETSKG